MKEETNGDVRNPARPSGVSSDDLDWREREGLSFLRILPARRGPLTERAAQIEAAVRTHCVDYPKDVYVYQRGSVDRLEAGVFRDLDFKPSIQEIDRVRMMISRRNISDYDVPPPLEDAPVLEIMFRLPCCEKRYIDTRDPEILIDTVASFHRMFFVPTLEEMVEAMKRLGLEQRPTLRHPESKYGPSSGSPFDTTWKVEKAIRRAQRAPRLSWPENHGLPNPVQEWLMFRGIANTNPFDFSDYFNPDPQEICSLLQEEEYIAFEPSVTEVQAVMRKLVREIEEAEARHRVRRRRSEW
jgi:hypothetical protein